MMCSKVYMYEQLIISMTSWKVNEAIMYAENDYGLMVHLEFDFYNTLVRNERMGLGIKKSNHFNCKVFCA